MIKLADDTISNNITTKEAIYYLWYANIID